MASRTLLTLLTLPAELRIAMYSHLLPSEDNTPTAYAGLRGSCKFLQTEYDHEVIKHMESYIETISNAWSRRLGMHITMGLQPRDDEPTFSDSCALTVVYNLPDMICFETINALATLLNSLLLHVRHVRILVEPYYTHDYLEVFTTMNTLLYKIKNHKVQPTSISDTHVPSPLPRDLIKGRKRGGLVKLSLQWRSTIDHTVSSTPRINVWRGKP